jgi:hypothetical protein
MKPSIIKLLFLFNLFIYDTNGQSISINKCDQNLLSRDEYEKCISDSVWTNDVIIRMNYIINLKTDLLPKYRLLRNKLNIPSLLQEKLKHLKITYDTVLNKKLVVFQNEMDRNQKYVQPKAYLSSLLSFEIFKIYPDVYAVLLNEIHLQLIPKTTIQQQIQYKEDFNQILKAIPDELNQKLLEITNRLNIDNNKISESGITKVFQGSISDKYKSDCNIINFLLWSE